MTKAKHTRKRTSSALLSFKFEESFANFLHKKGFKGFLADYLVFFLGTVVGLLITFLFWRSLEDPKSEAAKVFLNFFKYMTIFLFSFKFSQLLAVTFCQSFEFLWGTSHRYSHYVLNLMNPIVFFGFATVGLICCALNNPEAAAMLTGTLSASGSTKASKASLGEETFEILMSKVFLVLFFTSTLVMLLKVFIFFAMNMYLQEDNEKRLNSSTFKIVEQLRTKYFGRKENTSKDELNALEEDHEIARDIAEAIYSSVKAASPRGADSKGLKADDFSQILTRDEISIFFAGIDFDGSGDITKSELAQAIQLLYQEQRDQIKTNQDASSIMNRVEEMLKVAILYSAFLFASILFDFKVTLTIFLIVGGTLISWLTIDETLKEILNTFAFLFFVHPFDIGDKIVFQGEKYTIRAIHFLHTEMTTGGNTTAYIKNAAFCGEKILNYKRSDFQSETVTLNIHPDTISEERLKELHGKMNKFLAANSEDYMPSCSLGKLNQESSNSVKMGVSYMHKANFCNGGMYERRCRAFNRELYHAFIQCGLKYGA